MIGNTPAVGVESPRNASFISSEAQGTRSRDQVTLAAVNDGLTSYVAGTVLGKQVVGSKAAFANTAGNTGNGTASAFVLGSGLKEGVYTFEAITAGTTAKFQVSDPTGISLPTLTVGAAYSGGGLAFTVTTGGVAYAIGDQFTVTVGTASFANGGTNTGNGTSSAITVQPGNPGVVGGNYVFTAIDATHFTGVAPDGTVLPNLTVGQQYNAGGVSFTITAGGAAYIPGDTFTISTFTGNDKYYPVSATALDGTQTAAAVLLMQQYVGGTADLQVGVVARAAEVKDLLLAWPTGSTDDQIRNWTSQLQASGILVRKALV